MIWKDCGAMHEKLSYLKIVKANHELQEYHE